MPGALFAGFRLRGDLGIELAIAFHRFLEDLDRACQRADLVRPLDVRNLDVVGALGDQLDRRSDDRKRPRNRAEDDEDADADQSQFQHAK